MIAYDSLLKCNGDWGTLVEHAMLHGGDSDSTGTMAAGWYGALCGFDGVPELNYRHIEFYSKISELGEKIFKQFRKRRVASEESSSSVSSVSSEIGRAVQQECRDRSRMPSSA
eukprot:TRINITY_DN81249_c0_g1_i1.p1 TRINITY_DN81249_c0_g1~~TRINITY_DN81249_c0_g1_i1.p1  ORF type:complete len:122 (-),score=13.15 TRINITY_DN81249_c0_g1_i1:10-348(-)